MFRQILISLAVLAFTAIAACSAPESKTIMTDKESVIEVVTFQLKDGVSLEEFRPIDKAVEAEHVSKQPGFISRETAAGENNEWLVIVHWRSAETAEASMASFMNAPAATTFMDHLKPETMVMKRYAINR